VPGAARRMLPEIRVVVGARGGLERGRSEVESKRKREGWREGSESAREQACSTGWCWAGCCVGETAPDGVGVLVMYVVTQYTHTHTLACPRQAPPSAATGLPTRQNTLLAVHLRSARRTATMKLNVKNIRYLSPDDWRVLTAVCARRVP